MLQGSKARPLGGHRQDRPGAGQGIQLRPQRCNTKLNHESEASPSQGLTSAPLSVPSGGPTSLALLKAIATAAAVLAA